MLDKFNQIKQFIKTNESELIIMLGVALISIISFASGRLTAPKTSQQPIEIEYLEASAFQNITIDSPGQGVEEIIEGQLVASKNSDKYHLEDCPGAKRIAEHNKIWFASVEEAIILGYKPAANCPGL
jgi:uncharacterized protein YdeI (BOF family)